MQACCFKTLLLNLIIPVGIGAIILLIVGTPLVIFSARKYFRKKKAAVVDQDVKTVGFFHPFCNTGGGGERVLWCAIRSMQLRYPKVKIVVYTGDLDASPEEIMGRVHQRLNIHLPNPVEFVYLRWRRWVEPEMYPYFTLLGQSLGSVILGLEALIAFLPDLYIDTMGYAFTLPLFKYVGLCETACYTHYPTITGDMLRRVSSRVTAHNNRRIVARSPFLTAAKIIYYKIFAWMYAHVGRCADAIMVNSSWTEEHINSLWNCPFKTHRVYPPCDVEDLKTLVRPEDEEDKDALALVTRDGIKDVQKQKLFKIISVAQYRPEKDHPLQLRAMYQLRQIIPEELWDRVRLIFVGSCRNADDEKRVQDMQDLCKHLSLEENVVFKVNVPYAELRQDLQEGVIGLHAMWNEHFGIGVVECMAAGLIMVAHRSGGPRMDIVEEAEASRTGFLATDEAEYAQAIAAILTMSPGARRKIQEAARASVDRFSVAEFESNFLRVVDPFMR
ncbi:GDP-Man:Man(3)GlcNAc(2)-PP-Dol alpha-1,2-mannosyltransferase [Anabrus simplex]|uniref:GDP-Man:Man(3)GlcNAc(2)-PP-Dol alpha-1,2-mannosyltransferase n=1 Tax=Anabrus simplex TaxID=316456 RepID=UPI0034DCED9C